MNNLHLVPQILIDVAEKYKTSKNQNELLNLQLRLEACREYINIALQTEKYSKFFKKKQQ